MFYKLLNLRAATPLPSRGGAGVGSGLGYAACKARMSCYRKFYQMDIVVGDIVVELKSVEELNSAHRAQLFNYLRLTKKPVGMLINFGASSLQGERYGYDEETNECILLDKNMRPVYD